MICNNDVAFFTKNNNSPLVLNSIFCVKYYRNEYIIYRRIDVKATGIVRRIDDLGRVVIPKEIRRTLRMREGDPHHKTLTPFEKYCIAMLCFAERCIYK